MEALGESSKSFTTSALDGGEWSGLAPGRALPPGKGLPVPIVQEAGWAPDPVRTQRLEEKSLVSAGEPPSLVIQSVVRHYTDWATPVPNIIYIYIYIYIYINSISSLRNIKYILKWQNSQCMVIDYNYNSIVIFSF
jgi:hypothetical protein